MCLQRKEEKEKAQKPEREEEKENVFLVLMTWKWITRFNIQQSLSDSWLQFSGNTSISHIHLKRVATCIRDTKTQFLHLQFPIFKVLFIFMINLEKTLWCVKDISPFSFPFFFSSLLFSLVSPLARMLIFICFKDIFQAQWSQLQYHFQLSFN